MNADQYIRPPGCLYDILRHPTDAKRTVEVAVVQEHRFAFYFWLKWKTAIGTAAVSPALVSLDWHEDLAAPSESECNDLLALDRLDHQSAACFCWHKLNPLNDGHILSAAFLDLIGDIYVVRKQNGSSLTHFQDANGKRHLIRCCDSVDELMGDKQLLEVDRVLFDIDLDFFTKSPDPCGGGDRVQLVDEADIIQALRINGKLVPWILPRIQGMTIATEPTLCGGLINSNRLFATVSNAIFDPQLLSGNANWRHLTNRV